VTAGEAAVESARQRVKTALRVAYYETLAAEERLTVATRLSTVGHEMLAGSRQLFNVGIADRPDVLAAEAEAATLDAWLSAARAARVGAWRRLAAAAGELALTPQPLAERLTDALAPIDAAAERARILDGSPDLRAAAAAVARARAAVGIERSRVRPDLFLRGDAAWNREPIHDGRSTGWQFGVEAGVSLPVANRNAGGLAASLAAVRVAESVEATTRLMIEARWASAVEDFDAARALAEAYRTEVLPRSEQAYELYLSKYREMAAPYPQVLMAQRTLIEQHEQYVSALERAWRAALRLQGFVPDGM
jgi:cobalt-zinc-cadmium efflux system outer membrane protein